MDLNIQGPYSLVREKKRVKRERKATSMKGLIWADIRFPSGLKYNLGLVICTK